MTGRGAGKNDRIFVAGHRGLVGSSIVRKLDDLGYRNLLTATRAGMKLGRADRQQYGCNFISAMPTNLYGPNDNFDLESGHVLLSLIRKFHDAQLQGDRTVVIWGTGTPRREFLHVDDLADA